MRIRIAAAALALFLPAVAASTGLGERPERGEAHIWYLRHAGWLVRTAEHLLLFDFIGPAGSLADGSLSPEVLAGAGQPVLVFVSHAHGDHFDRAVLDWRGRVAGLEVILGWGEPRIEDAVVPADGKWTKVAGAEVLALHHEFDGIPEGFFLVRSGGLAIYHSGDHGTWSEPPGEEFRHNIDRLAAAAGRIDIAFLASFGSGAGNRALNAGDVYSIESLEPRVTFPMHCGGCEDRYAEYARGVSSLDLPTKVAAADAPGAFFRYRGGRVR